MSDADVVVLKFAQRLHGADRVVAEALGKSNAQMKQLLPTVGSHVLLPSQGSIAARYALFLSVPDIYNFIYDRIRKFGAEVLEVLAKHTPSIQHVVMTIHGVGYGLDETEAFQSQLAGLLDSLELGHYPHDLKRITIVERDQGRVQRLNRVLDQAIPNQTAKIVSSSATQERSIERSPMVTDVGLTSANKPHVFVVMPSSKEMDDYYYFGIEQTVKNAGYLCERASIPVASGVDVSNSKAVDSKEGEISTYQSDLCKFLIGHFNLEELRTLCFELGTDYDNLSGGGKEEKARELVLYLSRRSRVVELAQKARSLRDKTPWPETLQITSGDQFLFEQFKSRIDTATFVIADLSNSSPGIFLLIGYAWGKGCPTILLMRRDTNNLSIDLRSQRCLAYNSIRDLHEAMKTELLQM